MRSCTQGVLLDQFGVLHDGKVAFPEAIQAVKELAAASKKVFILSNSSRRSATALQKISSLGFPADCFAGVPTHLACHAVAVH
jgi:ribonucleotide monophosphatase NagD (HAD superfamily)